MTSFHFEVSSSQKNLHDHVLKVFRVLIADLVQQYNGGHPGGAMGMAAIGVALWKYVMKYAPNDPDYFNRDRFVLSNGHTCLFQYAFQHLVGYKHMDIEQLKSYHSNRLDSYCPGRPENEFPGIEVTTGALGQGISNAVGLAIATKNLQATYNKPDFPVVSNHVFCMVGDACLQEGVALESISLAGHLGLSNLTVTYDNNQITCDGSVSITNTENINEKMRACNWEVIEIMDGSNDIAAIVEALEYSKSSDKPTFINIHTRIGIDTTIEGDAAAHGAAFGQAEVDRLHKAYGFNPEERIHIPQDVYDFFGDLQAKGDEHKRDWNLLVERYSAAYPELAQEFLSRVRGELPDNWKAAIPQTFPELDTPSRASSGLVINPLTAAFKNFLVGTADLTPSVHMAYKGRVDFQNPDRDAQGDFLGRYIHYGIREHSMAAIANGIAAYNEGTFIPVTSSFLMFYLYAAPAVRYGALSQLQVIHVGTHDSIGIGEDGPTHQPISLPILFRSMPNMNFMRPCDSVETAGAWEVAVASRKNPSIISLSRHKLKQYPQFSRRELVAKGAYHFNKVDNEVLNIIGVGSEMQFAVEAAQILNNKGIATSVISFPSYYLFEKQPKEYKRLLLQRGKIPTVVIEAYAPNGWERYATAGVNMKTFGKSLPGPDTYKYFGFDSKVIVEKIEKYLDTWGEDENVRHEFVEL